MRIISPDGLGAPGLALRMMVGHRCVIASRDKITKRRSKSAHRCIANSWVCKAKRRAYLPRREPDQDSAVGLGQFLPTLDN
jgi:hypothetical protein